MKSVWIGWGAVVLFMPFFFFVVVEYIRKVRYKFQSIDDTLSAINQSNALVEFDTDGTILSCNDIFCQTTGYSEEELIGKHRTGCFCLILLMLMATKSFGTI